MPKISRAGKCAIALVIVGVGFLVGGFVMAPMSNSKIHSIINQKLPITPGSYSYDPWVKPPLPIYFSMYVFDLVNPEEVTQFGAKPHFVERGPFVYRLEVKKNSIKFHDNNTVSYRETNSYIYEPKMSCGPVTTRFTTVNLPMLTVANMIKYEYWYIKEMTHLMFELEQYPLFIHLSLEELVWGYEDKLLKIVKGILEKFDIPYDDHFGFFYNINNTDNGVFNVFTGEDDVNKLSIIDRWKGNKRLDVWATDECNMMNGTDGNLFHPFVKKSDKLYYFTTQIQRSLYHIYDKDVTDKGVGLYRFTMPDDVYYNPKRNPANKGFCLNPNSCLPDGLLDISKLDKGAPALISQPHFLGADQSVLDTVGGLHPNRDVHSSYMDLEPTLGIILNSRKPIQISTILTNSTVISGTEKLSTIYFPMIWFSSSSNLSDSLADQMKNTFLLPLKILKYARYCMIGVGGLMVVVTVLVCLVRRRSSKEKEVKPEGDQESIINNNSEERRPLLGDQVQ